MLHVSGEFLFDIYVRNYTFLDLTTFDHATISKVATWTLNLNVDFDTDFE